MCNVRGVCVVHLVCKCANNDHTIPGQVRSRLTPKLYVHFIKQPGSVAAFSAREGKLTTTLGGSARVEGRCGGVRRWCPNKD